MKNTFLVILISLTMLLPQPSLVKAKTSSTFPEINYEAVNPNSIFYPVKRAGEKVKIFFLSKTSPQKESVYLLKLLDRRFSELVYISDNKDLENFEKTAIRYNTTVGSLIDKRVDLSEDGKEKPGKYIQYLENIRARYEHGSAYWLLTQQAIELTQQMLNEEK